MSKLENVVLQLNEKLLQAVGSGDYETYASLCDPSLTCFEVRPNMIMSDRSHLRTFQARSSLSSRSAHATCDHTPVEK